MSLSAGNVVVRTPARGFSRAGVLIAVASILVSGCYTQQPLTAATPAPGARIILQLTDAGREQMANAIGPAARRVEGDFAGAVGGTWTLRVVNIERTGGLSDLWNRESITFSRDMFTDVKEKQFNRKRSWLLAGAIAATAFIAGRNFGAFNGEEVPGERTQPTQ